MNKFPQGETSMTTFRGVLAGILCLLILGTASSGASLAQTSAQPVKGGTAIWALNQDPSTVNPVVTSNIPDRQVGCIVYEGLIEVTNDYKIVPLLAKSWTIAEDGLTYSFELNKATWHDGQPFTSDDVKYSLLEVNSKYSTIFGPAGRVIDSIDAPAPDRVVIKLKQPFGPFIISLGCIQGGAILPAHLFRGTDVMTNPATTSMPVGTGAFKLVEWKRGEFVRLAKNPNYHDPSKPNLDELIGKVITQGSSRAQALKAGEIDLVIAPTPGDVPGLSQDPKLKVGQADNAPNSSMAFMNTKRKPLDDKRVRHALFMATDRDYLMKTAFFNIGTVGIAPFTSDIGWALNPAIDYRKMYPFDVAKANALLDEAGQKRGADGKRFAIRVATFANVYPELQQVALALKSMWQAVGVDVVIEQLEDAAYLKKVYTDKDFDVALNAYTSYSDPALGIARTFVTSAIGRPYGNASQYSNPEVDTLFAKGEASSNFEERAKYYREVQAILAEDLPVMQLRSYREMAAYSKRLNGLWGIVQGNGKWSNAWIEP
jgi:peptide/nickel transport system substrate-binding protein